MQEFMKAYDEKIVNRSCATCEFNFAGTCAGGDGEKHKYGDTISDPKDVCDDWGPSLDYFIELEEANVEYVNNYDQSKIVRKCGNCNFRQGNKCYNDNMPVGMPISRKNPGCDNWNASSEYVIELRQAEQNI